MSPSLYDGTMSFAIYLGSDPRSSSHTSSMQASNFTYLSTSNIIPSKLNKLFHDGPKIEVNNLLYIFTLVGSSTDP